MADQAHEGTAHTDRPDSPREPERAGVPDRLLDALVYLPAGIALAAVDEVPKLVAAGRERLSGQVATARVVGDLAVRAGRQYVKARSGELLHRSTGEQRGASPASPAGDSRPAAPGPEAASPPSTAGAGERTAPADASGTAAASADVPPVSALAIPGFDTLSASQVVQRLGGLSRDELLAVRAYEGACRGRRTVLHRVDQLLSGQAS